MVGMLVGFTNLSFVVSLIGVAWYENVKKCEPKLPLRLCSPPTKGMISEKYYFSVKL